MLDAEQTPEWPHSWRKIGVAGVGMENYVRNEIKLSRHAAKLVPFIILLAVTGMTFAARSHTPEAKKVNLPYVTIDHPQFISASQVTFLSPHDMVIGVTNGKPPKLIRPRSWRSTALCRTR